LLFSSAYNIIIRKSLTEAMLMDTKQELMETIKSLLLANDIGLEFLNKLEESELKTLIISISDRLEKQKQ